MFVCCPAPVVSVDEDAAVVDVTGRSVTVTGGSTSGVVSFGDVTATAQRKIVYENTILSPCLKHNATHIVKPLPSDTKKIKRTRQMNGGVLLDAIVNS